MYGKHNMRSPGDILEQNNSIYMLISNSTIKRIYLKADFKKKRTEIHAW